MKQFPSITAIMFGLLSLVAFHAVAQTSDAASDQASPEMAAVKQAIRASFSASRPGITLESIRPSQLAGVYAVSVANGPTLYVSADGKHFVLGDLYEVAPGGFVNLAEQAREGGRAEQMAQIDVKEMIVFAPKELPAKASIMIFTDVDCYYCQKLHKEVPDLNRIGIEVRYLAYPRAGIGSESYKKIASAWCAADKPAAMTKLKNRQRIVTNVCPDNPVAAQFKLGQKVGVTGTPAMVTTAGKLMPGYMPALQLANALGVAVDPELAKELAAKQAAQTR